MGEGGAGHTHIYLTENDVYYAANNHQGVKHVPGIRKITLNKAARANSGAGEEGVQRKGHTDKSGNPWHWEK